MCGEKEDLIEAAILNMTWDVSIEGSQPLEEIAIAEATVASSMVAAERLPLQSPACLSSSLQMTRRPVDWRDEEMI